MISFQTSNVHVYSQTFTLVLLSKLKISAPGHQFRGNNNLIMVGYISYFMVFERKKREVGFTNIQLGMQRQTEYRQPFCLGWKWFCNLAEVSKFNFGTYAQNLQELSNTHSAGHSLSVVKNDIDVTPGSSYKYCWENVLAINRLKRYYLQYISY